MTTVRRDAYGIPHIRGASAAAAIYGQGYTTGVDRAWQIEYLRLRAEGRTAEVFGSAGIGWDVFIRRAQVDQAARRIYHASSPRTRQLLRAYARGVNSSHTSASAVELTEFEHRPTAWQPWTSISIFIVQHLLFGRFATKLWRLHTGRMLGPEAWTLLDTESSQQARDRTPNRPTASFFTDLLSHLQWEGPDDAPSPIPDLAIPDLGEAISGSNAWGIAAAGTDTGAPLIAGDPHRFLEVPGVYQQVHLACDAFDVVGLAFAGVPGVPHFAHNSTVAWGITNAMADYQDVYVEQLSRSGDQIVAATPAGERVATVRTEQVNVRDGEPVEAEVIQTHNGSVIFGGPDQGWSMSLRSPMLSDPTATFDAVLDLLFAKSIDEVEQALTEWVEPPNRIVVGDTSGGLRRHTVGWYPTRAAENYWLPVPGWDARYQWTGYEPTSLTGFDAQVSTHTVVANQRIDNCPPLQPLTPECASATRAARINVLLATDQPMSVVGCTDIHRDVANAEAQLLLDLLAGLPDLSAAAAQLRSRLLAWDTTMTADSVEAYLYAEFRSRLVSAISASAAFAPLKESHGFPPWLAPYFVPETRIAAALEAVVAGAGNLGLEIPALAAQILEQLAADTLETTTTWGQVHVLAPLHGMDFVGVTAAHPDLSQRVRPEPVALAGDAECVQANASAAGLSHVCRLGSAARFVWDLAHRDGSRWVVPLGSSGDPSSAHFQDQTHAWARGDLIEVTSDWEVLAHTTSAQEIL